MEQQQRQQQKLAEDRAFLDLQHEGMEKKMETTIVYKSLFGDEWKDNGNYYSILGFMWG